MLERYKNHIEAERRFVPEPKIRFHHLRAWGDLVQVLHKKYGDSMEDILGYGESIRWSIIKFATQDVSTWLEVKRNLERVKETSGLSFETFKDYWYVRDVVGSNIQEYYQVRKRLVTHYTDIFDSVVNDKNIRVSLTKGNDGMCDSCVTGRHCRRSFFQRFEFDRDDVYEATLLKMLETDAGGYGTNDLLGKDCNGLYIRGELLFNTNFHLRLDAKTKEMFPKVFKRWDK